MLERKEMRDESSRRRHVSMTRMLAIAGLGLVALAAIILALANPQRGANGDVRPVPNAIAETYAVGSFASSYEASADVTLPARTRNVSWYTNWIMFVAADADTLRQPFVQVGEIRWKHASRYPSGFIAFQEPGRTLVYVDEGRVAEGKHALRIVGDEREIRVSFDGRVFRTFARSRFFDRRSRVYVQFGSEVKVAGDAPTGSIADLRLKDDRWPRSRSIAPRCIRYDRGLDLSIVNGRYVPSGKFTPGARSGFRDCGGVRV